MIISTVGNEKRNYYMEKLLEILAHCSRKSGFLWKREWLCLFGSSFLSVVFHPRQDPKKCLSSLSPGLFSPAERPLDFS